MIDNQLFRWCVFVCVCATFSNCNSCARQPSRDTLAFEGAACTLDEECETGLCDVIPGGDERKCIRKCTTGCRDAEVCATLGAERLACVPERAGLCGGCSSDTDCPYPGDKCIRLGAERFCGRDCAFDGKCPSSFRCAEAVDVNGLTVPKQCQPSSGTCACIAATAGQQVPCEVKNSFGTCVGSSTCNPLQGGFQECATRTPVAELCNNIDDDCDGQMDEGLDDLRCGMGACERVVAACANGRLQTCTAGMPTVEICNQLDDDCNGTVDDPFNTQTDVANCGACGRVCTLTNAVPKCQTGACAIDRCVAGWVDLDAIAANGCEHPCTVSNGGVEICDGADNDCDGTTDEGFNLLTDPTNCGRCGLTCNLSNATISTYACIAGQCAVGACVMGRGDCNQQYADGCEENLISSLSHCGQCGLVCAPANASPQCQMGSCRVQQCTPGFRDCNMLPVDGCEVNSNDDVTNCGACGITCLAANATSTCQTGTCRHTCLANWFDADNVAANGCEYACIRTNNGVEACDGIDNDCDNQVDEDFNRQTDVNHCGVCNRQCLAPSANTLCSAGSCGIGSCVAGRANCNTQYLDGCEVDTANSPLNCGGCGNACGAPNVSTYQCVASQCRVGTCNANRANCNSLFSDGCEVDTASSVANCGGCGLACNVPFATPACASGSCAIGACIVDRANCNSLVTDGCEVNLGNDVNNCGACGTQCTAPNATSSCVNRACTFVCDANRYNLDGLASNGCEYACTATGSDVPDLAFVDSDCDGIDGNAASAVFVDGVNGNDSNTGTTRSAPRRTIAAGIAAASANGRASVFISRAAYGETVTLSNGISLFGGYDAAQGWSRAAAYTTTISSPSAVGVVAQNLAGAQQLQLFTIRAANAVGTEPNGDGRSSIGVLAENVGALAIRGCVIQPGAGTTGASMPSESKAADGQPGGPATGASEGAGGASSCGANGGPGGPGVSGATQGNRGTDGSRGPGGADPSQGSTGGAGAGCDSSNGNGQPGLPVTPDAVAGAPGSNGGAGSAFGVFSGSLYAPVAGGSGVMGQIGGGGGGGGAGGSTRRNSGTFCSNCNQVTISGGGGGGGGGGCGGPFGRGGRGGGGSFGVVSLSSTVALDATQVQTGSGGNGGTGGSGGDGGDGGGPGSPGTGTSISGGCATRTAGNGATGGRGGNGGKGGSGAGGSGGPSVCVVHRGAAPSQTAVNCSTGTPGAGGLGGLGGSQAPNGSDGVASPGMVVP